MTTQRLWNPMGFNRIKDGSYRRKGDWLGAAKDYYTELQFQETGKPVTDRKTTVMRLKHKDGRLVQITQDGTDTRILHLGSPAD